MKLARFRHLAACLGADFERWPTDEREAARTLAANNPVAGELLAEAQAMDAMLDAAEPPVDPAQVDRILEAITARLDNAPTAPGPGRVAGAEGGPATPGCRGPERIARTMTDTGPITDSLRADCELAGFVPPPPILPPPMRPSLPRGLYRPLSFLPVAGFLAAMAVAGFMIGGVSARNASIAAARPDIATLVGGHPVYRASLSVWDL